MSEHAGTDIPTEEVIDRAWSTFKDAEAFETVRSRVLKAVDEECRKQLNAGDYDPTVALATVFEAFEGGYYDADESVDSTDYVGELLEETDLFLDVLDYSEQRLKRLLCTRLVEQLDRNDELLYVYDRQRVRGRVAEMARYFALMRQRITADTDFEFTPSLVKMVKMDVLDRQQPIFGADRPEADSFQTPLREINSKVSEETTRPAFELEQTLGDEWRTAVQETLETFKQFLQDGLPDEFDSLARYQSASFSSLYLDAVTANTEGSDSHSNVITASTGGGKTEAFMFPALAYCITAWKAGISGNNAVFTYPRRDLCNNQFRRVVKYAFMLNRQLGCADEDVHEAPISVSLQHGGRKSIEVPCPYDSCSGTLRPPKKPNSDKHDDGPLHCSRHDDHVLAFVTTDRKSAADVIVTTQNSLHIRLMDLYGADAYWNAEFPTKFVVIDEVHVYTEQAGMHVANVIRRFKQALRKQQRRQQPTLVASSATINNAEEFTKKIFDTETAAHITPAANELETTGREYIIFVKATEPRDVAIPVGDSVFKPRDEWEDITRSTASNLSCMIQVAFGFYHTMRKERTGSRPGLDVDKDKILGFVDSIDSVSRLGGKVQEAERENGLYKLRRPDAVLSGEGTNPDCPKEQFQSAADEETGERAVCDPLPPNPHLNSCPVYEAGECWWTMRSRLDLKEMRVAIHKSGTTSRPDSDENPGDEWEEMISTSALEVGFDHPSIIGTFQYRAPRNVPGFVQRKGRGGRDSDDKPVTVAVLGSTSTDAYYFHHSEYLSNPGEKHMTIPLDQNNRFIRREHMTAAVFDYFNLHESVDSIRIYRGGYNSGPDIDQLQAELEYRREELADWLRSVFATSDSGELNEEVELVLDNLETYAQSLSEPIAPEHDETPYWKFFNSVVDETGNAGRNTRLDDLLETLIEGGST
ncbi:DEAD/DEAH box helicase [Salinigranum halophilum]|uniref:DEAD/DEAH box helicase n=1 Tax=Salinigranum halophilum TaxID=2565931 RepID=UPI00115F5143|nr:DEAD/DEAH box helicase [Salinigranum halophilum]